ncbi:transcription factor IIA, alpha/beta subunit-domain-containing protein [Usnea florida]
MDDVIENCQTTFEEDGVNQQTLDDLRKVGFFSPDGRCGQFLLQQLIFIVAGSIFLIFSALRFVQFKKFGFFIDASSQILAWRNVRFFLVNFAEISISQFATLTDPLPIGCPTSFNIQEGEKTWQNKLSALHIGTFPWEPPPAPQPMTNPTVPSNVPRPQQVPSSGVATTPTSAQSNGAGTVRIKTEPGYEQQGFQNNGLPPTYGNTIAQQRAAANLQQKFGAGANVQISQLQAQAAMGTPGVQPQRSPMNIQLPPQMTDQQRQEQAEYKRRQQAQQYQNLQHAQQRPMVNNAQTDGADEWDGYVAQRRLDASKDPKKVHEADLTIRQQVQQMNRSMEGGGLMMPLSDQSMLPQLKKRKNIHAETGPSTSSPTPAAAQTAAAKPVSRILQMDGNEDDDEDDKTGIKDELFDDDEDAINSDLDDPDDNVIEEEPEDGRPQQIMLCTYDKVARVKNKWKCTLKDGVLTTGGKEYVFHRAQGEFEW